MEHVLEFCVKPSRVLIVEDDELQICILKAILTKAGFEVDTVTSGLAAVWKVRERRYDAVLVDYRLPEIDGLATARLVNDFLGEAARPVLIALTATPSVLHDREKSLESAFDAIIEKSGDAANLVSVIKRCLTQAPDRSAVQEGKFSLLLQDWLAYDEVPFDLGSDGRKVGPARILVVEDDEGQRTLLSAVLERQGYIVETAADGLEAVRKMREGSYDLALIDHQLPEIDGRATGDIIQNTMRNSVRPRLVGLTASPTLLSGLEATAGSVFDEVLGKTSDLRGLLGAIDRILRGAPNPAQPVETALMDERLASNLSHGSLPRPLG